MITGFYETQVFPWVLKFADKAFKKERAELFGMARGRVLEIGAGSGVNLDYYGTDTTEIIGIEPNPGLLSQAQSRVASPSTLNARFDNGDAHQLDYPDSSFDTVITCLVLCTIPNPQLALCEAFRVLKPGGQLLFFEHVASERATLSRWQYRLNPLWKKIACGCELNRDTRRNIEQQGFEISQIRAFDHPKIIRLVEPVILGVARKPERST